MHGEPLLRSVLLSLLVLPNAWPEQAEYFGWAPVGCPMYLQRTPRQTVALLSRRHIRWSVPVAVAVTRADGSGAPGQAPGWVGAGWDEVCCASVAQLETGRLLREL